MGARMQRICHEKRLSVRKKSNMWRLLTLHPAEARFGVVGVVGMDVGVGVRRGEGELDGMKERTVEGEGEEMGRG